MKITSLQELVVDVNKKLGPEFCDKFRYKRKELGQYNRATSSGILFKLTDPDRDWAINEGGGTEIQYHIFYRENEIGYGLGFNAQYVPFANNKSPVEYIKPFVEAILFLYEKNDDRIKLLEQKGFSIINGRWDDLKNIQYGDYYLFGKTIKKNDDIIPDKEYEEMISCLKTSLYDLYIAIWEQKQKQSFIMNTLNTYTELVNANKNLILTGAPGTGKTFLARQIAQHIIFGEVKNTLTDEEKKQFNEQCGFVQFHPSYDYTDFVEGLRPKQDDNGNIGFERKNGVFKEFCKNALLSFSDQHGRNDIELCFDESWQKLLDYVREKIAKGELTKIGIWEYGLSSAESLKYTSLDTPSKYTFTITKKNVFDAYRGLKARPSGYFQKYIVDVVKYMQEKFGLKPYKKSEDAKAKKEKERTPYVFIIDEINRGEISKIFGELFFSIDPGYRGLEGRVKTQYQNLIEEDDEFYDGFYVPENVYIIGTMNDIDRSVESMDFAFRRRFAFKEITAKDSQKMFDSDDAWGKQNGISRKPEQSVIDTIKSRMDAINYVIWHKVKDSEKDEEKCIEGFSSEFHIGASYFLKLVNYKKSDHDYDFDQLWDNHLEGLLLEYMRGMTDVPEKIKKLAKAFGYLKMEKYA